VSLLLKNISMPLARFSLKVELKVRSRITAIFGPSGSGKTTLLDLIAGLRHPESAFIQLGEQVLIDTAKGFSLPPHQRGIGYVPQDLALFPHLSVRQNLLYGAKPGGSADSLFSFNRVTEVLEVQSLISRGVGDLSGGEKQRVALARALLASPRLLLLDEPLASLDAPLKARIIPFLTRIRDEFHIPMLYVTHDRFETLALADEMVVLVEGAVRQTGSVQEVFSRPANVAVAGLLTVETVVPGQIVKADDELTTVAVGSTKLIAVAQGFPANTSQVHVCIRAEDVIVVKGSQSPSSARNQLPATVVSMSQEGPLMRIELDCGFKLTVVLTKQACEELAIKNGDPLFALVKAPHVHLIPR